MDEFSLFSATAATSPHQEGTNAMFPPSSPKVELKTDPWAIDVPNGGDDPTDAYRAPTPDSDAEDNSPSPEQPPTEAMALEALDAIKLLLYVLLILGKCKCTIMIKINGWLSNHLEEISKFLNFYTAKESKTHGLWTELSIQAAVAKGRNGSRHGPA
ncbi:hypothetical protein B0H10DRAFT_1948222 [Mycena sp. CBHHK59/15]|nr:hypothetical protein B0H10DRAFT_1948222 [Mycena sp. CBHHK59/15]